MDSSESQAGEDFSAEDQSAERQKAGIALSDLLSQALKGWIDPAFFRYAEIVDNRDGRNQNDNNNQGNNKDQGQSKSQADNQQNQEKNEKYHIEDPIERFALFILVDFATRLLYENDYENWIRDDGFYTILKEEAMQDLFFHPMIAEKVMEDSTYSWESKKERELRKKALENVSNELAYIYYG